jgi:hypothetical protein
MSDGRAFYRPDEEYEYGIKDDESDSECSIGYRPTIVSLTPKGFLLKITRMKRDRRWDTSPFANHMHMQQDIQILDLRPLLGWKNIN